MTVELIEGDSREILRELADSSIDSVVTDPPYDLKFMGKAWDNGDTAFDPLFWREVLRVLKPGGHVLAFGGTRTYHRLACAIEDGGFDIRDQIGWLYGSGFPKSSNQEGDWEGWGTALKPAWEPIVMARKPLIGTVPANLAAYGTGALNIADCRVGEEVRMAAFTSLAPTHGNKLGAAGTQEARRGTQGEPKEYVGRWPANVIHDGSDEVLAAFPESKGQQGDVRGTEPSHTGDENTVAFGEFGRVPFAKRQDTSTSAARFFYCAKASKKDRDDGVGTPPQPFVQFQTGGGASGKASSISEGRNTEYRNTHPTVKPTDLMRYLCRLVTPPGGTVLDPFMGSGSTGRGAVLEGFSFIGVEMEPAYFEIADARIAAAEAKVKPAQAAE